MKIGVLGATGRVGQLLINIIEKKEELSCAAVMFSGEQTSSFPENTLITNDFKAFLEASDLIIDFSSPNAIEALIETALNEKISKPLVIATTGLNEHQQNLILQAGHQMPVLYATNMSLGIAVLNKVVATVSEKLRDFNIEITEMHHRYKKDAPSGTALTLAESVSKAREQELKEVMVTGREGIIGERSAEEIAVLSLRGGDIAGRHTVGFYNDGEFLEFNHTATSRETFAVGAIKASTWLIEQKPGIYTINDALGI